MSQVLRLYKYYLKKLFKSWYFWVSLGLLWFFSIILPLIFFYTMRGNQYISESNGSLEIIEITYKQFTGRIIKNLLKGASIFTSGQESNFPIFSTIWGMFLSVWWIGIVWVSLLFNPAISSLVGKPKEDGEDKTVLTTASPIQRNDIVLAKMGAFFTFFGVINLIGIVLPFFTYYCWAGGDQGIFTAPFAFSFLALAGLVFPLLFFLLIHSILFFVHMVSSGIIANLFSMILFVIPIVWIFAWRAKESDIRRGGEITSLFRFLDKGKDLMLTKPLFVIPFCLGIGTLFFYLYWNAFIKKDFN